MFCCRFFFFLFSPPRASSPHSHRFALPPSLSCATSPLFTFFSPLIGLKPKPGSSDPSAPCPGSSLSTGMNKSDDQCSLSLPCSTLSRSRQTGTERGDQLSVAACQPITTPRQQPRHLSPPPSSTPPPPTYVPLTPDLFMSFFHYVALARQSAFLTFNYAECQSSSRLTSSTLDCLTPPTDRSSPQQQFTLLRLVLNYRHSFFLDAEL